MLKSGSPPEQVLSHQKSLKIKPEDKFFSRLLSKETSMASPSFRVYHGGVSVSVPFLWESQPGTPKHLFSDTSLPPLTPPPSYYAHINSKQHPKKHSKSKLLHTLFPRINDRKKPPVSYPPSSLSSSSSSSWSSSMSIPMTKSNYRGQTRMRSSFDEELSIGSPTSTLSDGIGRDNSGGLRAAYSVVILKKAFLAMVGCGSG